MDAELLRENVVGFISLIVAFIALSMALSARKEAEDSARSASRSADGAAASRGEASRSAAAAVRAIGEHQLAGVLQRLRTAERMVRVTVLADEVNPIGDALSDFLDGSTEAKALLAHSSALSAPDLRDATQTFTAALDQARTEVKAAQQVLAGRNTARKPSDVTEPSRELIRVAIERGIWLEERVRAVPHVSADGRREQSDTANAAAGREQV